ncbi:glycoside hydrolase family 3 N-terminal domain-containing protein [Geminocystis sp. CENA526]|uniref:glycoside hydrolase family 3 N-terminal domain-containing protein n=1 Tax=Geminocystis sp. CENA526 TaxID=1355871 RepID=UPI003D6EE2FB
MQNLSLREKIGQLIIVRTTGYIFDHQIRYPAWEATQPQLKKWLQELNLGGVILLGGSCSEIADRTKQLQSWAKTPLLIAADIEEGVGQRFSGATWFPPPMALSTIAQKNPSLAREYAKKMGEITAREALAIGINWVLAPITDVNNNPDNPVINIRSFGDNPDLVADLATAFIQGCQEYPVLTTAKHFPGHGDTATDSHLHLPQINHSKKRLQQIELVPFQRSIEHNVDSIMTAHLLVEKLDAINPATLSFSILTQLLRDELNFSGLIVTDALIMGGVAKYASQEEIAVKALLAGADILLMPENPEVAVSSIERAVKDGILSESRIDESLQRIAHAKNKLSFAQPNLLEISSEEDRKTVKEVLKLSMSFQGKMLTKTVAKGINLVVVQDLLNCDFLDRQAPAITIPEKYGYQTQLFDQRNLHLAQYQEQPILLQAFIRGNPFLGNGGLTDSAKTFYEQLLEFDRVEGMIIYGSPYILEWFLPRIKENTPWVFTYGQMPQAQELTCQRLFNLSTNDDIDKGNFL